MGFILIYRFPTSLAFNHAPIIDFVNCASKKRPFSSRHSPVVLKFRQ